MFAGQSGFASRLSVRPGRDRSRTSAPITADRPAKRRTSLAAQPRIEPGAVSRAQRRQQQLRHCAHRPLAQIGKHAVQLLVEERVDKEFSILAMQIPIDPHHSKLEVRLTVVAHAIIDDPAPRSVVRPGGQDGRL